MKFKITVKPSARRNAVELREDGSMVVHVTAPPIEGRANKEVVEILARHFQRPKRNITILSGARSKHKIVEVR